MDGWRYFAERLNGDGTATLLDPDLPLGDVGLEDALSAPGGMTAKIDPELARLKGPDGKPLFDEWHTALWAECDGEVRGGGIFNHSSFTGSAWAIECVGFMGYWHRMPYTGNGQSFVNTDTLDIVRAIVDHVQGYEGGDLGLEVAQDKSGVLVGSDLASEEYDPEGGPGGLTLQSQAYKLAWYKDHDLLSNIDGLASDTPFDYHERHWFDGEGNLRHSLEFGRPEGGRLVFGRRRNDLRFVYGENIFTDPGVERAGDDYADEVYVLGAGEGAKMRRGRATAPRTRLRRPVVVSDPSIRETWRADRAAVDELRWRTNLEDLDTVVLRDHHHAPVGAVNVGDEIYIEGDTGWVEIGAWYRVIGQDIKPQSPDIVTLSVVRSDRIAA